MDLRRRWDELCARVGVVDDGLFDGLVARYDEPHRRYHDRMHLEQVTATVESLGAAMGVGEAVVDAALLAAWFHDAVYDPRATDNEAASAVLARTELSARGADASLVDRVAGLVEATAGHGEPDGDDAALLFDADLAVLAGAAEDYDRYARQVRDEYGFVPDDAFRRGRAAVLRALLERPLFTTAPMQAREPAARANVRRELLQLEQDRP